MPASNATSPNTRSTRRSPRASPRNRLGRGRQTRRPGAVVAGLFRRQAGPGDQRRHRSPMAAMGDPNASIPTPQPVHYRPMFGALAGRWRNRPRVTSSRARRIDAGLGKSLGLPRPLVAVSNTRGGISKKSMIHNDATPNDRGRSGDLRSARRRRAADLRAGRRAADGAALFPVLMNAGPCHHENVLPAGRMGRARADASPAAGRSDKSTVPLDRPPPRRFLADHGRREILLDLPEAIHIRDGDALLLEDGAHACAVTPRPNGCGIPAHAHGT